MLGWWWHLTGPNGALGWFFSTSGRWYGVGSSWGTAYAIPVVYWHHQNCHEARCLRIGRRITVEPTGEHVRRCGKHHRARHGTY